MQQRLIFGWYCYSYLLLQLTVYHHHLVEAHTEIGSTGEISLLSLVDGPVDKWFPLFHKGDPAGEIHVLLSLERADA